VLAQDAAYQWNIPAPFPKPAVPVDNRMSADKVELGRRLFYDRRMSVTGQQSCASCHRQELAFTDGHARAVGATGALHPRGSMSLANVVYNPALTWANPAMNLLEEQALVPMLGTEPVELGLKGWEEQFLREVRGDPLYQRLFPRAFPETSTPYTLTNVVRAIAAFERTIVSMQSPYDRYRYGGEADAISASAKRGGTFFFSGQRGSCFQCHGGWNFNGDLRYEGRPDVRASFFNTGLYNVTGAFSYPAPNTGLHQFTRRPEDIGKFRAPTLRNIAVTAPYMHDGSIGTLGEVLDHYAAGGRTIMAGPAAGVGHDNRNKASNVHGFPMTASEKQDLIAFLESLTDSAFLRNPALSNPWK
jgi:cytochrome c peroxidase